MIEPGLRTWLLTKTAIIAELSGSGAAPVFIGEADPNSKDCIVVSVIDTTFGQTLDPNNQAHRDLVMQDVEIDVKCQTAVHARDVASMILDELFPLSGNNFTGAMGDRTVEAVNLDGVRSGVEEPRRGESKGRHIVEISLSMEHRGA